MKTSYTKLTTGEWGVLCDERPTVGEVEIARAVLAGDEPAKE